METTAKRMAEAMEFRGIKQVDLCEKTGIGKSSISTYLSGEYAPKQKNLYKIARALDVSEAWLMGYDDVPMERDVKKQSEPAAESDGLSELDKELVSLLRQLTPEQACMVIGFVRGILTAR